VGLTQFYLKAQLGERQQGVPNHQQRSACVLSRLKQNFSLTTLDFSIRFDYRKMGGNVNENPPDH